MKKSGCNMWSKLISGFPGLNPTNRSTARSCAFRFAASFFLSLALVGVAQASVVETDNSQTNLYTVPGASSNLLAAATLSANPATPKGSDASAGNWSVLTDGSFGDATHTDVAEATNNTTLTYTLNISVNVNGYNLSTVDFYTGWEDNGRVNQNYSVYYSTVATPTNFILLQTVSYTPPNTSPDYAWVHLAVTGVSGAGTIKFVYSGAQENGYVGSRELCAAGTPTGAASPPTVSNAGGATNVTGTSATVQGYLSSTGGLPTTVYVMWGTSDAGATMSLAALYELGNEFSRIPVSQCYGVVREFAVLLHLLRHQLGGWRLGIAQRQFLHAICREFVHLQDEGSVPRLYQWRDSDELPCARGFEHEHRSQFCVQPVQFNERLRSAVRGVERRYRTEL